MQHDKPTLSTGPIINSRCLSENERREHLFRVPREFPKRLVKFPLEARDSAGGCPRNTGTRVRSGMFNRVLDFITSPHISRWETYRHPLSTLPRNEVCFREDLWPAKMYSAARFLSAFLRRAKRASERAREDGKKEKKENTRPLKGKERRGSEEKGRGENRRAF